METRQAMCHNVTWRRVERKKYYIFWVRACSLRCPACHSHEPVPL